MIGLVTDCGLFYTKFKENGIIDRCLANRRHGEGRCGNFTEHK